MPGSGEFFIGSGAPMTIRIGVSVDTFDVEIQGPPSGDVPVANPIADVFFATALDFTQKCVGVQWAGPRFVYTAASYISEGESTISVGIIMTSKDGTTFTRSQLDGFGPKGCGFIAGIRGGKYIMAVGYSVSTQTLVLEDQGGIEVTIALATPLAIYSDDKGMSWRNAGVPARVASASLGENDVISISDSGQAQSVAYDPDGQEFWISQTYYNGDQSGGGTFDVEVFKGVPTKGFGGAPGGGSGGDGTTPMPLPAWPSDTLVNDANVGFDGVNLFCNVSNTVKYASTNAARQIVKAKDGSSITMDSTGHINGTHASSATISLIGLTGIVGADDGSLIMGRGGASQDPLAGTAPDGYSAGYMFGGGGASLNTLFASVSFS